MKVKRHLLIGFLKKNKMTQAELARKIGISTTEVNNMLDGKAVDINTARKFIHFFGADEAQRMIDWETIGKKNPLADNDNSAPNYKQQYLDKTAEEPL